MFFKTQPALWWVYVIQSGHTRFHFRQKGGPYYVGCTNSLTRRLRQHNGEIVGGGKYTSKYRPWRPRAVYGPYKDRSEAMKAEYALKRGKRGVNRTKWTVEDSAWCRGEGPEHSWVKDAAWCP